MLRAIHINDSKNPLGSHKDRHACIGKGYIGLDAMKRIVTHPVLNHLPFYLETPNDLDGYKAEIELLRSFCDLTRRHLRKLYIYAKIFYKFVCTVKAFKKIGCSNF